MIIETSTGVDNMEKNTKFDVGDLLPLALTIVVAGIGIAYGLSVLSDVKSGLTANSYEANATQETIEGVSKFSDKMGLIVTVIVAAILIGILVRYLMVRSG